MDDNNNFRFRPNRFKEHLSPFGRNVLDVMLQQWKEEQDRNVKYQHRRTEHPWTSRNDLRRGSRRVLTFHDSNVPNNLLYNNAAILTNIEDREFNDVGEEHDTPFDYGQMLQPQAVLTSSSLVKNVREYGETINDTISREHLLYSSDSTNQKDSKLRVKPKDNVFDLHNQLLDNDPDNELIMSRLDMLKSRDTENNINDITWNNIFDDIIPEVQPPLHEKLEIKKDQVTKTNLSENIFSQEKNTDELRNPNKITIISNERVTPASFDNTVKRRKRQIKTTDAVPKKIKKIEPRETKKTNENTLRKQKYTKVVKNWLESVDPNNPVDEDINLPNIKETQDARNSGNSIEKLTSKVSEITILKPTNENTNKKAVQAQLTNKDGVMKFKKPNPKKAENEAIQDTVTNNDIQACIIENNNNKHKKSKTKFVAPIKSQIHVKDIEYKIINIDKDFLENLNMTDFIDGNGITMILIFSNGFCQLNRHHTDDSCNAEGIMINIKDIFYYLRHADFPNTEEIRKVLIEILINTTVTCYEAKNLLIYLATQFSLELNDFQAQIFDAKIGGSLIDPDNPPENFSEVQRVLSFTPAFTIATECRKQKTAWYLTLLNECADQLRAVLCDRGLWGVFMEIEMRLVPLVADMERRGVKVDLEKLKTMESLLLTKIKTVEQECYKAAGKTFQINSTVQVRTILYEELKLDSKSNVKIRETITTGAKSTSETMLRNLMYMHPLPKLILEYRHLHKAHATFLAGITQHVKEGVVKPVWVQTAAATGRIASSNPNLQAIPKAPFSLIMFPELGETENQVVNFRSVYVARPGFTLLAADFQHIECRVFAHAAADTVLLDALATDRDLFRVLAAKWLNKPEDAVSTEDRERTKRIVYASLYGAGNRKLMEILNVSYDQTLSIITSFSRTFPSLKSFGRSVVSRCVSAGGRLSTLCGRARYFQHISSTDFTLKSHAERQAVNFIVQGSAADLCKLSMVDSGARLRETGVEAHLVLQIHDELVWEVRSEHLATACNIVQEVMENCGRHCGLAMRLPVALSQGQNWGEMYPCDTPLSTPSNN